MSIIKLRRDIAANWTAANPVLTLAEPGLETDTLKVKYGDGVTPWNDLSYSGSNSEVYIDSNPPSTDTTGTFWWDSISGRTFVYYNGGWEDASPPSPGVEGPQGPLGPSGPIGPSGPDRGPVDRLTTGTGLSTKTISINSDGDLTLPTDGSIDTYSGTGGFKITTDGQIQFASGYSIGGSDTGLGLRMATDRGTILFGNHPEVQITSSHHFHIMAQDPGATDLFFGSDENFVKLPRGTSDVVIGNGNNYNWQFGNYGTLTLPLGGTITETARVTQGGDTPGTIVLTPNNVFNPWNNLTIYNTAFNPETQHIHLASGDLNRTEIVLGNDSKFVKVNIDGSVCVNSSPYYFEDAMAFEFQNTDNTITEMRFSLGVYPRLYYVAVGDIITDVSNGNTATITGVDNAINLSITCSIPMDTNGTSTLGYSFSKSNNNGGLWQFGSDGTLILPNNSTIQADANGSVAIVAGPGADAQAGLTSALSDNSQSSWLWAALDGAHVSTESTGTGYNLWTFGLDGTTIIPDNSTIRTSGYGSISLKSDNADIVIMTDMDNSRSWTFGGNHTLIFPDTSVQTTAWNDQAFMASMASYDGAIVTNTATIGTGGLTVNGPVQFNGPFTFQGTATVINSNSGTFYGDVTGVGALYAGVAGSTPLPATVIQSAADVNDYIQNNFQNLNHGNQASTEWVATNDLGNDSNNYIDMGIAGHGWDGTQANSVGTAAGPSDSWVYTQGTVSSSEGGNLILGTIKDGKAVKILAGSNGAGSLVAQFNSSGLALTTGTSITFPDGTRQTSAVSSSGTVVLETLNVSNISATNITINGQSITAGVTRITAGTGTHVSTTTGALTLWTDTFNTSTLVAQAVTALSIPYSNVTGTPNLSGYATQSAVSTLQISVNNLTNTVSTLTTTATVNALIANSLTNYATQTYVNSQGFITSSALSPYTPTSGLGTIIANSLTNYATQSYVTTQGYTTTATVNALIANSLTNVVKTIVAGTGTAVSVSGNTVTIWTTASGGIANLNNLSSDISFSTAGVGAPTFNTTSTGVKISYYPSESATMVDYATGIDAGVLWNSIPSATSNFAFKWYGGTSTVATLNGLGTLTATKFVGDGSSLTNVTVNVAGSILGTGTNVTLVAGSYSYLFDNTGVFTMPNNSDIVMTGTNATITAGGAITAGYNSPGGATAFIAGNAAVNNIALGYQPTSGAANMAIRDLSTVTTVMYFDAGSNTTSTNSQFQFRSSSAYTTWAKIDQYGVNQPTRPAFRVYGAGTTSNLSTTVNTNGILNGNNFAVDYNQGTALSTSTGIFTAPVAGLYSIHLVARVTSNSAGQAQVAVIKNNGLGSQANQVQWETGSNPSINHFGVSTISKLAAGDTLVLKVALGSINFDGNDSWAVAYIG